MNSKKKQTVIIVEDEVFFVEILRMMLIKSGFDVVATCLNGEEAVAAVDSLSAEGRTPDAILMDINLPGTMSGIEAAAEINKRHSTAIVFLTGYNQSAYYEELKKIRYHGYLLKPVEEKHLRSVMEYAVSQTHGSLAKKHHKKTESKAAGSKRTAVGYGKIISDMEKRLVGVSGSIRHIREEIMVMAPSAIPILITGETGTGKEVVARELFMASNRSNMPFMAVNCASLGALADSELFGHLKGAFTGASNSTSGYVGASDGGTLFLDEVGDLPMEVQAKLLRFLDRGEYSKVGDSRSLYADVRIISASNTPLDKLCNDGKFRQDLLYRLSGAVIHMLPLRSRAGDIPILTSHFLQELADNAGKTVPDLLPEAMKLLSSYQWPGNIRELRHTIHNLLERCQDSAEIGRNDVAKLTKLASKEEKLKSSSYQDAMNSGMEQIRRKYFTDLLAATYGKSKKALELSRMNRNNFYAVLKKLDLSPKDFR